MNQRDSGWTIGRCIDAPEKTISYNHAYCIDALSQMADEWETEYEFVGKQVSLWKVEYNRDNPLPLSDVSPASDAPTTKILRLSKFYIFRAGNKTSTPANTEVPNCCCPKAKQSGSTVNTSKANRDLTAVRLEPIKRMRTGSPYAVPINRYPHRQKIASIVRKYTPPVWGQ